MPAMHTTRPAQNKLHQCASHHAAIEAGLRTSATNPAAMPGRNGKTWKAKIALESR